MYQFIWAVVATRLLLSAAELQSTPGLLLSTYPLSTSLPSESDSYKKIPNPREKPDDCKSSTGEPSWLCNSDSVLSDSQVVKLETALDDLYKASGSCPCYDVSCTYSGLPMVVIVLQSFTYESADKREELNSVGEQILKKWKFDTCMDGVVTIVVANENLAVTVYGAGSFVSSYCQEQVTNTTEQFFDNGDISTGLEQMIQQYRLIAEKDHNCTSHDILGHDDHSLRMRVVIPIVLILIGIIIAAIITAIVLVFRSRDSKDIKTEAGVPLRDTQRTEVA